MIIDMALLFFEKFDLAAHPDPGRANKAELRNAKEEGAAWQQAAPTSLWAVTRPDDEICGARPENTSPGESVHRPDRLAAREGLERGRAQSPQIQRKRAAR